jgi:hypothetical protein
LQRRDDAARRQGQQLAAQRQAPAPAAAGPGSGSGRPSPAAHAVLLHMPAICGALQVPF